jgi:hypothetical protein
MGRLCKRRRPAPSYMVTIGWRVDIPLPSLPELGWQLGQRVYFSMLTQGMTITTRYVRCLGSRVVSARVRRAWIPIRRRRELTACHSPISRRGSIASGKGQPA